MTTAVNQYKDMSSLMLQDSGPIALDGLITNSIIEGMFCAKEYAS